MTITSINKNRPIITNHGIEMLESLEIEICDTVNSHINNGIPGHIAAGVLEQFAFQLRLSRTDDELDS